MGARFTRVQEDFTCLHCGMEVRGTGYTNHCPRCLWSRHVDVYPGDRAATCHAAMEPVAALSEGAGMAVVQRCTSCGHLWRNKVTPADDREAVLALFGRAVPHPEAPQPPRTRPAGRSSGRRRAGNSSHRGRGLDIPVFDFGCPVTDGDVREAVDEAVSRKTGRTERSALPHDHFR